MKTVLRLLSIFIWALISQSCNTSQPKQQSYFYLKGNISSIPITMQMYIYGHQINGVYWYDTQGKPIDFFGDDTTLPGSIVLKNYINDGEETIILNKAGKDFSGTWSSTKKPGSLKVILSESKSNIEFDFYSTDSIYATQINGEEVTCSYSGSMIWPRGDDKFSKTLAHKIKLALSNDSLSSDQPDIFLKKRQTQYIDQSRKMFDSMSADQIHTFSMESYMNIGLLYQSKHNLCIRTRFYDYEGGAHGYGGDLYKTYDLESSEQLILDDIFTASGMEVLPLLIEKQIKQDRGLRSSDPISSAGLFDEGVVKVTDNFYLTPSGIGFFYNQYEIAPYASGQYDVFLNYDVLKNYLRPTFKK